MSHRQAGRLKPGVYEPTGSGPSCALLNAIATYWLPPTAASDQPATSGQSFVKRRGGTTSRALGPTVPSGKKPLCVPVVHSPAPNTRLPACPSICVASPRLWGSRAAYGGALPGRGNMLGAASVEPPTASCTQIRTCSAPRVRPTLMLPGTAGRFMPLGPRPTVRVPSRSEASQRSCPLRPSCFSAAFRCCSS